MTEPELQGGVLSPYRVLDLTDEKGLLCGKLLGDLGADVIKIEPPGGDPARNIGPFYHDEVDPEKSLFWWAFNTSKRGITLDIETSDGQETFKKLVKTADFVIESFSPGYMDGLGLGYSALEKINPGIIMVSITPFGQTGPYKDYKASDIVAWAMGGVMYQHGDADRPPIRISHHSQSYLHAAAEASVGAMVALHFRKLTGEGQQVDVSIQECVARCTTQAHTAYWDIVRVIQGRGRLLLISEIWPCKDGYVSFRYWGGPYAKRWNSPLVDWMDEEGMAGDYLRNFDWEALNLAAMPEETPEARIERMKEIVGRLVEPTRKFFMTHTKAELLEGALKRRVMLYPVSTSKDILESVQLAAREFWVELEHPELGTRIKYPGAFTKTSDAPPRMKCRAPLIGEHNAEILDKELGISVNEPSRTGLPGRENSQKVKGRARKPLEGIKIADFGFAWAGPITTKTLADYGAEVIRIEGRSRPEVFRTLAPFKDGIPGLDRAGTFNQDNTGKLSIAVNLAHPEGAEIARKLAIRADVVVENFAGGVMERMGLGYDELKKIKSDIIMLSTCMQGHTGPYATHPGYGFLLTPLSGFNHITGWPDHAPVEIDSYTDFIAPHFHALAILAALDYRQRTGKGQYIDVSQYEIGIQFLAPVILDYTVNQRVASRIGNRAPDAAPHGAYRCQGEDRWCAIAVCTDAEWQSFCKVIGNPAWTGRPEFSTLKARKENDDELDRLVEEWTINHPAEKVMMMMQAAGVAAGVVETGEDMLDKDPQLRHRQYFWELDHPEVGRHRVPAPSFVLSKSSYEMKRAPLLGEHNEYILKELLGMSDEEIANLIVAGVIE